MVYTEYVRSPIQTSENKLFTCYLWETTNEWAAAHMENEDKIPKQMLEFKSLGLSDPELPENRCRDQLHLKKVGPDS
jgi:hypothetical protein